MALTRVDYPPINILQLPTHKICVYYRTELAFDMIWTLDPSKLRRSRQPTTIQQHSLEGFLERSSLVDNTKKSIVKPSFKPHHSASGIVLAHFFGSTRSATHVCCLTKKLTTIQIWLTMTWKFFAFYSIQLIFGRVLRLGTCSCARQIRSNLDSHSTMC